MSTEQDKKIDALLALDDQAFHEALSVKAFLAGVPERTPDELARIKADYEARAPADFAAWLVRNKDVLDRLEAETPYDPDGNLVGEMIAEADEETGRPAAYFNCGAVVWNEPDGPHALVGVEERDLICWTPERGYFVYDPDEPRPDAPIVWEFLGAAKMRSIVFLDKPLLQADAFHLLCGRKGVGKGTYLTDVAARVTRGELGSKRNVLWIASEDSPTIDILPRLTAAGADTMRVKYTAKGWIQLPRDIDEISREIRHFGDVGMLVIDPIANHITGKNSNSETDVRDAIAPLNDLADEYGLVVFAVRHLTEKEIAGRSVLAAVLGSSAWLQTPRVALAIVRDDDDAEVAHIQVVGGNRLGEGSAGRRFKIEGVLLDGLDEEVTRIKWLGDSAKSVDDLLEAPRVSSKSGAARDLILDVLEGEGEQESDTLDARIASETGLAARTVQNLRKDLRAQGLIKSVPVRDEHGTVQEWRVVRTAAPRT